MRVLNIEQGSPKWYQARMGVPTASEFGSIITPKRGDYATAADIYINQLIDEIVRPDAGVSFGGNRHTERGKELEPEARELYAFEQDVIPHQVGFILNDAGTLGCSPDSLIGNDGGLEIKCPDGPTHVRWLRAGGIPDEHKPQVHGSLIITGRAWWDFLSFCPGYPPVMTRVVPDSFTEKLQGHLERFLAEYAAAKKSLGLLGLGT